MDPRYKRNFFTNVVDLKTTEERLKTELAALGPHTTNPQSKPRQPKTGIWAKMGQFSGPKDLLTEPQLVPAVCIEYNSYISEAMVDVDPLTYWREELRFPILKQLVLKYHTIMATSAPTERLYSNAGNIITLKRNRLTAENLSKLLFISHFSAEDFGLSD